MQASRKFEQMEVEGILLRAGADDLAGQSDLDRLSLPSSAEAPRPLRPSSAQVGSAKDRSAPKPSRFNLQQAIHAKPFVPKTSASQQVSVKTAWPWFTSTEMQVTILWVACSTCLGARNPQI